MKLLRGLLIGVGVLATNALANVEKAVFLGPPTVNVPKEHPTLDDLRLDVLTPSNWTIRTHVAAEFPTSSTPRGRATWLLLDGLAEGRRYEARICWAASQPTSFVLDVLELPTVWATPELIGSLAKYSQTRQPAQTPDAEQTPRVHASSSSPGVDGDGKERESSLLFLRVLAAADYFTADEALMREVPPVHVDIILDPFVLNVLPRSLVPTAMYVVVVAVGAWFLARGIASLVVGITRGGDPKSSEKKTQ